MSKEEIEKLLDHYGVLFTEAIADKLLEIITRERADAIDECINFIKNHSTRAFIDSDGWGCSDYDREEIFKLFWLDDLEQLKEQNK